MRKEIFVNEYVYHVYNRGIDQRTIFTEDRDFERFLITLRLFNNTDLCDYDLRSVNLRSLASYTRPDANRLVDILQWSLMANHFHLLLKQHVQNGISAFMQRVGTGFASYFNQKHERVGRLFQGPFKAKLIHNDDYFTCLATYIPLNPLDLYLPDWRSTGVTTQKLPSVKQLLSAYRWTSFNDYFNTSPLPNMISKDDFFKIFGGSLQEYERYINTVLHSGLPQKHKERISTYYEAKPRKHRSIKN